MSLDHVYEEAPDIAGVCSGCGCTDDAACPGGCIWANADATLCSRCARGGADLSEEELADLGDEEDDELVPATDEDWRRWRDGELE